jgi:hypothetical protein
VYAIMSGLGVIWLYFKLPETKGKDIGGNSWCFCRHIAGDKENFVGGYSWVCGQKREAGAWNE